MVTSATAAEIADRPSEAEIDRLNADLAAKLRDRVPLAARAAPKPPAEARPPRNGARKPLGLHPIDGAEPEADRALAVDPSLHPLVAEALAGMSAALRGAGATIEDTFQTLDIAMKISFDGDDNLYELIKDLRSQVAELKLAHGKLVNENTALRLILENLRIRERGERGIDGDRGPPGRDGLQGAIGPVGQTGARGSRGQPGDRIVSWRLAPAEFLAFPIAETGKELPPLNLMPFFAEYNVATEASDVDLATEQASAQRARLELETARV